MLKSSSSRLGLPSLLVAMGMIAMMVPQAGLVFAADRTVVGELWSQDA